MHDPDRLAIVATELVRGMETGARFCDHVRSDLWIKRFTSRDQSPTEARQTLPLKVPITMKSSPPSLVSS